MRYKLNKTCKPLTQIRLQAAREQRTGMTPEKRVVRLEKPTRSDRRFCEFSFGARAQDRADRIAALLHCNVHRIQFDEDGIAAEFLGDMADGSCPRERVEDRVAGRTASEDAGLHKLLREHGVM